MRRKYSPKDFNANLLPKDRKEQFSDLFKTRGNVLRLIFLFSLLFSLPILLSFGFKYFLILPQAKLHFGSDSEGLLAFIKLNSIVFYAIDVVCYLVLFIGYSGLIQVMKEIIWGLPVSFRKDFAKGVKENIKFFIIASLFISIIRFAVNSFGILSNNIIISYIPYAIFILILPIFLMSLSIVSIYESKVFRSYYDATAYCLKKPLIIILFLLYPIVIIAIKYFVNDFFAIPLLGGALLLINVSLILPIIVLMWYLFSISLFDKYTNESYYKEYYQKGLRNNYMNTKRDRKNNFLLK